MFTSQWLGVCGIVAMIGAGVSYISYERGHEHGQRDVLKAQRGWTEIEEKNPKDKIV